MSEEPNQPNICYIYSLQVSVSAKLEKNILIILDYLIRINGIN